MIRFTFFLSSIVLFAFFLYPGFSSINAQAHTAPFEKYHSPDEVLEILRDLNSDNEEITYLHKLGKTPGGLDFSLIEIGPEREKDVKNFPAVLIVGNMEGDLPLSTEAALRFADLILQKPEVRQDITWYILPLGNPDAAFRYFKKPLYRDTRNSKVFNDDMDDLIDEDSYDDLNNDGLITMMRVKDPSGEWLIFEEDERLMRKAERKKGEKGIYKLYSEGIDNDSDGEINEDVPGGVNTGINFPHLHKPFTPTGGIWPGSEEEIYNLMRFVFDHPEIAMTFSFGSTNWCLKAPKGGRKGSTNLSQIKIPKNIARRFNIDAERTYTMAEVMEIVKGFVPPGMEVTESMVASFLGLGGVVNPLNDDLNFYNELSERFQEFLKENGMEKERLDPKPAKDGSFELWSYYHLGVPTFSMDLWTLPKPEEKKKGGDKEITPETLEKMSSDEFLELGEEKIDSMLKSSGAPPQYNAKMVIGMVKGGNITPKKMAQMMKKMGGSGKKEAGDVDEDKKALALFSDKYLGGKGLVQWSKYEHPDLGEVEIGGAVPFAGNTPPPSMVDSLLNIQLPWIFKLVEYLPRLKILKTENTYLGAGIYELETWVENSSYLPFPTAMGKRNERVPPAILTIEGKDIEFLSGKERSSINDLWGFKSKKMKFLIKTKLNKSLVLKLSSKTAWSDEIQLQLGGSK